MKLIKQSSPIEKIPFYYFYIGRKKDKGIDTITAAQIADEIKMSTPNVRRDLSLLIENPGRKNYGYNVVFLYNQLQKLMNLVTPCNMYLYGHFFPFFKTDELARRNLVLVNKAESIEEDLNISILEENNISLLILTKKLTYEKIREVSKKVKYIINLTDEEYQNLSIPVYNIDIFDMISSVWQDSMRAVEES